MGTAVKKDDNRPLFSKKASSWMKGAAIIMVILSHYAEWWSWFYPTEGLSADVRMFCSLLGDYGVAIFFLFSGYGLAKSAGEKRIDFRFVLRRLQNVYLPYLVIALLIQVLAKSVNIPKLLIGDSFWFMTVIFLLYLSFMFIWFIVKNKHVRVILFAIATAVIMHVLFIKEMQVFWYNAIPAFLLGVIATSYEKWIRKAYDFIAIPGAIVCTIIMFFVAKSGLHPELQNFATPEDAIYCQMGSVLVFTLLISFIASVWKFYDPVIAYLGKASLYLYLTHTYIFMQVINAAFIKGNFKLGFVISSVITVIVSILFHLLFTLVFRFLPPKKKAENK